jgi:mutual gliding-motility protein MglA
VSSSGAHPSEIAVKVVYYGPAYAGKTSSLQFIHRALRPDSRGQLVSLATGVDRTLYFDFLPVKLPKLRGAAVRVQLYTVPGQVHYNSTRKLVLTGADALVFVADSQRGRMAANVESLENLVENLAEQGLSLRSLPLVLQLNKRDVPDALPTADLERRLNTGGFGVFESVATRGTGVFDALKAVTTLVLADLRRKSAQAPGEAPAGTEPPATAASAGPSPQSGAFREVADAIDRLDGEGRGSGPYRLASRPVARDLSDLLAPGAARDQLDAVGALLDKADYVGAVRQAVVTFKEMGQRLVGAAVKGHEDAGPLAALLAGMPASRYLRFHEITGRVGQDGAVSSTDALFAFFFLCDLALRAEELRK